MDLTTLQRERLSGIIESSCMTLRSFKLLADKDLVGAGFPKQAVLEMRAIIGTMTEEVPAVTPSTSAIETSFRGSSFEPSQVSSPLSDASRISNQENELPELTADALRLLTQSIDVGTYAGKHEFNRILVAEIIKVHFFFFLQKYNRILSAFDFLQRQPEDAKLNPTSRDKLRYAKLAIEVKPELRSLDPVYPCVIILTFFLHFWS